MFSVFDPPPLQPHTPTRSPSMNVYRAASAREAAACSFDESSPTAPYTTFRQAAPFGAGVPRLSTLTTT